MNAHLLTIIWSLIWGVIGFAGARGFTYFEGNLLQLWAAVWVLSLVAAGYGTIQSMIFSETSSRTHIYFRHILLLMLPFYLGIICGFVVDLQDHVFWVDDTHNLHLPGARLALQFLIGNQHFRYYSIFGDQINLVYLWTALFIRCFGEFPWVTTLSLFILRVITWAFAYKLALRIVDRRTAFLTVLIMALNPTQIFFGLTFYKDPMLQLLCTAAAYYLVCIYQSASMWSIALCLLTLAGMLLDRFYMVPMFALPFLLSLMKSKSSLLGIRKTTLVSLMLFSLLYFFYYSVSRDFNFDTPLKMLRDMRSSYQAYSDINQSMNYDIPYPLAFIKIMFTPFFSPKKFEIFKDFSAILTWGSFISQAITLLAIGGFFIFWSRDSILTSILLLPWLQFLFLFAYVAPYSSRQRDALFVLVALPAAACFKRIKVWFQGPSFQTDLDWSDQLLYNRQQNLSSKYNSF